MTFLSNHPILLGCGCIAAGLAVAVAGYLILLGRSLANGDMD